MLSKELKQTIVKAVLKHRENFSGSDTKFAVYLGINPAQYNRLKKGETENLLSEAKWMGIARRCDVPLKGEKVWQTASTPVYNYIMAQLTYCQENATNGIFCDKADIGKSYAAKVYVRNHSNSALIDCSQVKSKQKLVRAIAREFGVDHTGRYHDVYADVVYYLKSIDNPLIILDEAGDLDYGAFLELKALWNATENHCAWYMMGADGLSKKIERGIEGRKVGFTEIFSRYGSRFQHLVPKGTDSTKDFIHTQASLIIEANASGKVDVNDLIRKTSGSLRRIYVELTKIRRAG